MEVSRGLSTSLNPSTNTVNIINFIIMMKVSGQEQDVRLKSEVALLAAT